MPLWDLPKDTGSESKRMESGWSTPSDILDLTMVKTDTILKWVLKYNPKLNTRLTLVFKHVYIRNEKMTA